MKNNNLCGAARYSAALLALGTFAVAAQPVGAQTARIPWYQPFDSSSIWNTPIGTGATYTAPIGIGGGSDFAEPDVEYHFRGLSTDPSTATNSYAGSIAFPYYPLSDKSYGLYPNNCCSYINPDGLTVFQFQYWSRSTYGASLNAGANFQVGYSSWGDIHVDSLDDNAAWGSHGGSEMSSFGGSLRLGEATSADPIRHALKLNIDAHYLFPTIPNHASADRAGNGYRWPAFKADGNPPSYSGSNPDLALGSLLAIPPSVNINNLGLQTAFGRKIAWTLQNFGVYIVDNSGYTGDQMSVEENVTSELNGTYGAGSGTFPDSVNSDLLILYQQLCVVTNNGSASKGGSGSRLTSGGGSLGNVNNIPNGSYYIQNRSTGEYLNVWGDSTAAGAQIHQYPFQSGAGNEIFTLTHIGNGYYTLTGKDSGLAVSIAAASLSDGALLEQDALGSTPADNQLWSFLPVDVTNGYYLIQARHSDKALDVPSGTTNTVQLDQNSYLGSAVQQWKLVPVGAVPSAPAGLTATAGSGQVSLTWAAAGGATSYSVFRGTSANGESTTAVKTGLTSTAWTDTGRTNGTKYYYKVKAVNSTGSSPYSNEASATPTAVPVTVDDTAVGTGTNQFNFVGSGWQSVTGYTGFGYYNNSEHYSNTTGDYFTLKFTGTKIAFYAGKNNGNGIAGVSIDGGTETQVDTYANVNDQGNVLVYTSATLASGTHTLKVRVTGSKNASSSDVYISPDRVIITP